MDGRLRYLVGAVAFGFAAVWILATLAAALVCLLSAAVGYGAVLGAEHALARRAARSASPASSSGRSLALPNRTPERQGLSLQADELNKDLGYVYEPRSSSTLAAADDDYGWPPTTAPPDTRDTEAS